MPLHESGEDYLETLFVLEERSGGYVRQIDIAAKMGFSKASISKAMSTLMQKDMLNLGIVALCDFRAKVEKWPRG